MKQIITILTFIAISFLIHSQEPIVPNATAGYFSGSTESVGSQKQLSIPVNLSTGVPQISFPIGSISSKSGATVGYSLAYDASGRRTDELASYMGWGWNIVGGGQINRVIKGAQDERLRQEGCLKFDSGVWTWDSTATDPPYVTSLTSYTETVELDQSLREILNYSQPDEFYFNFNGRNGMFIIDQSGTPQLIPYQNLKIEFQPCLHWFKITDEAGYEYLYNSPTNTDFSGLKAATTWYLASIKNPYGETEFSFTYQTGPEIIQSNQVNQKGSYTGSPECPNTTSDYALYHNKSNPKRIASVTSNANLKLEFKQSNNRLDISGDKSLDEVWIITGLGAVALDTTRVLLDYDYFKNEFYGNERLKLTGIRAKNGMDEIEPVASFVYDESNPAIQNELTAGKDHWGYYNGLNIGYAYDVYVGGGTRRVDPSKNQTGILKEITSATGSKTIFNYETNTYSESPNGAVVNDPPLDPLTISASITVSPDQYYDFKDEHTSWEWAEPSGGFWPEGYEYPNDHCGLGYTFHHPDFPVTTLNPEDDLDNVFEPNVDSDGQFDPSDDTDIDHPDNAGNMDEADQEFAYVPVGKYKTTERIFTVDNPQTIDLVGSIAKSVCETHVSSVKIVNVNPPYDLIWEQEGEIDNSTPIDEPVELSMGTYKLVCIAAYPYFEDVAPEYLPYNFDDAARVTYAQFLLTPSNISQPSSNIKYAGGLRLASMTVDDGDSDHSNDIITKYEYNLPDDNSTSSGYLFTNPNYSYTINSYLKQYRNGGSGCSGDEHLCHECDYEIFISSGTNALVSANGSYLSYQNVRERKCTSGNTCNQGWTDNLFSIETSTNPNPLFGEGNPYKYWRTGLLLESKVFKQDGTLITLTTNTYDQILSSPIQIKGKRAGMIEQKSVAANKKTCKKNENNCENQVNIYQVMEYTYYGELYTLESSISTVYDQTNPSKSVSTTTIYKYESAIAGLPSKIINETNDPINKYTAQKIKYVGDYVPTTSGSDIMNKALRYMVNTKQFGLNTPVETLALQGNDIDSLYVVGGSINTLRIEAALAAEISAGEQDKIVADATYKLELDQPVAESSFTMSIINGSNQFSKHGSYRKIAHVETYDANERVYTEQKENDILTTYVRAYADGRVLAEVTNASAGQCAYTSFENNAGYGGWSVGTYAARSFFGVQLLGFSMRKAKTGTWSFKGKGTDPVYSYYKQVPPGNYIVSYWATAQGTVKMNGTSQTPVIAGVDEDLMGFKYYEYLISVPATLPIHVTAATDIYLDELRLYPQHAQMKTTAHNLDGTVRTSCGINNRCTTYLYDNWKRPQWTLDDNFQILTHTEYHNKDFNTGYPAYQINRVVTTPDMTKSQVEGTGGTNDDVTASVEYSDGLGRSLQNISIGTSPMYGNVVSFHEYDALGREPRAYLPYVIAGNQAGFIEDPLEDQQDFYESASKIANTDYAYRDTEYEASPLSRVLRQGNVGEQWQLNTTHTVAQKTLLNDADEVLLWKKEDTYLKAMEDSEPRYYPANTLIKKEVTDEHGHQMWEYTNARGQVVCKRAQNVMRGSDTTPFSDYVGTGQYLDSEASYLLGMEPSLLDLSTYYLYDDFGRLVYELPVSVTLECDGDYTVSTIASQTNWALFNGYVTAYEFDKRSRQIRKKKPGEDWTEYVYNNLNQVVLSKSPALSAIGSLWNYVKYDALGRPVQTGLHTNASSRASLQSTRDGTTTNLWETKSTSSSPSYNNNSFPNSSISVHTETYYDDYIFNTTGYTYGTDAAAQGKRTRGAVTGTKTLVLESSPAQYLLNVNYYDFNGRLAVQYEQNRLSGYDKVSTEYDYTGKVIRTLRNHYKLSTVSPPFLSVPINIQYRYEYDRAGRATKTWMKIDDEDEFIVSKLMYNELGQVIQKHLHITGETNTGMQIIDYRYNERGWLTKINNADLVDDGDNLQAWDVFGEELVYHELNRYISDIPYPDNDHAMEIKPQYNGNVAAIKWKTKGDPELAGDEMAGHSYVLRYDRLGQMTGAYYAASTTTDIANYTTKQNHWDERVSYLSNGQISNIYRKRGKDDSGNILTNAITMDNLSYTYITGSNKVEKITDAVTDGWFNKYSHFIDGSNTTTEYTYDYEGRMTEDLNKGIALLYNNLDLVKRAVHGTDTIRFIWDAKGSKLAKTITTTTTTIDYLGGMEYINGTLTHIATPEGIARKDENDNWVYDYYLKDHLGNVRAVITNEDATVEEETATMEWPLRGLENLSFDNIESTGESEPPGYPYDPGNPSNAMVSSLSAALGDVIGPAKLMRVPEGTPLEIDVQYWYTEYPGEPLTDITEILAGTLLNLGTASTGLITSGVGEGMDLLNNVTTPQFAALHDFIEDSFDTLNLSIPQAYLVYMYFSQDSLMVMPQYSGIVQVSEPNELMNMGDISILPSVDGFLYTYVTNRSTGNVHFDNLSIRYWKPTVRVQYDYYPYGLPWENPVTEDIESLHDCAYQGKEFQFAEFGDGEGLAFYDFHARMYDSASAMWSVPDPASQFANPYLAMGNNPIMMIDPDGEWIHIAIGAVAGAAFNVFSNWNNINSAGDFFKFAGVGAAGGAVGAATGNFAAAGAIIGGGNAWAQGGNFEQVLVGAGVGALSGAVGGAAGGAVGKSLGGFAQGFVQGAAGGATGGFVGGFFMGAYQTGDLGYSFKAGLKGAIIGGISAGVAGGIIKGLGAAYPKKSTGQDPMNFWSGKEIAQGRTRFSFNNTHKIMAYTEVLPVEVTMINEMADPSTYDQIDLEFGPRQQQHNAGTAVPGKSYLTMDHDVLLNDLNNGNFTAIGVNHRGMPMVKFNHSSIGNVVNIHGVNLGPTPYGIVHINSLGQVHVVPWLPK